MTKTDRRIERTRTLLQQALIDLLHTRDYDTITIQDIVDRANVGRTTFYLHFHSKGELLLQCHETIVGAFQFGPRYPRSRETLLSPDVPAGIIAAYRHLQDARAPLGHLLRSRERALLLQRLHDWSAHDLELSFRAAFVENVCCIPIDMLAHALAGAQIALLHWWLREPHAYPPEALAQAYHRLQRAAIRDAYGLPDDEAASHDEGNGAGTCQPHA